MNDERTPTIEELLVPFFTEQTAEKTGRRLRRVQEVERHLREYLEVAGHRGLSTVGLGILNMEREFAPEDAFIRSMRADDLLFALRGFLEPAWLPDDRVQARVQVGVVDKLVAWMQWHELLSLRDVAAELGRVKVEILRLKEAQRVQAAFRS
ncbi:hypothetical protein ACSAGD_00325 [Paramicrobacterium sp. CJ85]|uniref:hypothetical protein n=1 Tax=Paramicrobacterium sp. CJ85 TaxID=3445355 RepID=UPI003F61B12D